MQLGGGGGGHRLVSFPDPLCKGNEAALGR